ncbi:hypothetical protein L3V82_03395 [Thiotrichales bacterium 19S3-7]|nr:hypothetical protein [Thiotrichales bacterium 19S3-7]MCF6801309.1 hypothetical protein [Thiotrichales bacterium 19S3-11]
MTTEGLTQKFKELTTESIKDLDDNAREKLKKIYSKPACYDGDVNEGKAQFKKIINEIRLLVPIKIHQKLKDLETQINKINNETSNNLKKKYLGVLKEEFESLFINYEDKLNALDTKTLSSVNRLTLDKCEEGAFINAESMVNLIVTGGKNSGLKAWLCEAKAEVIKSLTLDFLKDIYYEYSSAYEVHIVNQLVNYICEDYGLKKCNEDDVYQESFRSDIPSQFKEYIRIKLIPQLIIEYLEVNYNSMIFLENMERSERITAFNQLYESILNDVSDKELRDLLHGSMETIFQDKDQSGDIKKLLLCCLLSQAGYFDQYKIHCTEEKDQLILFNNKIYKLSIKEDDALLINRLNIDFLDIKLDNIESIEELKELKELIINQTDLSYVSANAPDDVSNIILSKIDFKGSIKNANDLSYFLQRVVSDDTKKSILENLSLSELIVDGNGLVRVLEGIGSGNTELQTILFSKINISNLNINLIEYSNAINLASETTLSRIDFNGIINKGIIKNADDLSSILHKVANAKKYILLKNLSLSELIVDGNGLVRVLEGIGSGNTELQTILFSKINISNLDIGLIGYSNAINLAGETILSRIDFNGIINKGIIKNADDLSSILHKVASNNAKKYILENLSLSELIVDGNGLVRVLEGIGSRNTELQTILFSKINISNLDIGLIGYSNAINLAGETILSRIDFNGIINKGIIKNADDLSSILHKVANAKKYMYILLKNLSLSELIVDGNGLVRVLEGIGSGNTELQTILFSKIDIRTLDIGLIGYSNAINLAGETILSRIDFNGIIKNANDLSSILHRVASNNAKKYILEKLSLSELIVDGNGLVRVLKGIGSKNTELQTILFSKINISNLNIGLIEYSNAINLASDTTLSRIDFNAIINKGIIKNANDLSSILDKVSYAKKYILLNKLRLLELIVDGNGLVRVLEGIGLDNTALQERLFLNIDIGTLDIDLIGYSDAINLAGETILSKIDFNAIIKNANDLSSILHRVVSNNAKKYILENLDLATLIEDSDCLVNTLNNIATQESQRNVLNKLTLQNIIKNSDALVKLIDAIKDDGDSSSLFNEIIKKILSDLSDPISGTLKEIFNTGNSLHKVLSNAKIKNNSGLRYDILSYFIGCNADNADNMSTLKEFLSQLPLDQSDKLIKLFINQKQKSNMNLFQFCNDVYSPLDHDGRSELVDLLLKSKTTFDLLYLNAKKDDKFIKVYSALGGKDISHESPQKDIVYMAMKLTLIHNAAIHKDNFMLIKAISDYAYTQEINPFKRREVRNEDFNNLPIFQQYTARHPNSRTARIRNSLPEITFALYTT